MGKERREAERVRTNLPVHWEGAFASRQGTVIDISTGGCFILSDDEAIQRGELLRLEVQLPTGRTLYAWGEVVYQFPEIGFALRFINFEQTARRMLEILIDFARTNGVAAA
jgi:hypothetical protein